MDPAHVANALVVDDDGALRLLLRVNLELDGFTVREAATVADAEAAVRSLRPDVVLLDVTGSVDVEIYRDRADAIVAKPFNPEELVKIARRLAKVDA